MKKFYLALLIFFSVIFGFWLLLRQNVAPSSVPEDILTVRDNDWMHGKIDASVSLIEYVDFQCPACGSYFPMMKRLGEEYGDRVKFIVRHFPLTSIHPNSMPAAIAAEAAGAQGVFWEMNDILFERQKEWSSARNPVNLFVAYAETARIDSARFLEDYESDVFADKIETDINSGIKAGVQGTPTFFLNGEKIQNPRSYEAFKALIEDALIEQNL